MNMRRLLGVYMLSMCLWMPNVVSAEDYATTMMEEEDVSTVPTKDAIFGEDGFVEQTDSFRGWIIMTILVGAVVSGYALYKKSS